MYLTLILQCYALVHVLLSGSVQMNMTQACFPIQDQLYLIDMAYNYFNDPNYYTWVNTHEACLFASNQTYWNITNQTFTPTYDFRLLDDWIQTNGTFINLANDSYNYSAGYDSQPVYSR